MTALVTNASPSPGEIAASWQTARRTPVTFKLACDFGYLPCVRVKHGEDPYRWPAVYDPERGFAPLFDDQSTIADNGDGTYDFSILPSGGWWHDFTLIPGQILESDIMTTVATPHLWFLEHATHGREANQAGSSGTPIHFDLTPGASEVYLIDRIVMMMDMASAGSFAEFGDIAALTNGVLLKTFWNPDGSSPDTELTDLLGGYAAKNNSELTLTAEVNFGNGVDSTFGVNVTFDRENRPIRLNGAKSAYLRFAVRDDLTTLSGLRILAIGAREDLLS